MNINLFSPTGPTVNLAASSSNSRVAIGTECSAVRIKNLSTDTAVFIAFGDSTITVTAANGIPIGPGEVAGFSVGPKATHVAGITASGNATFYVTPGNGS